MSLKKLSINERSEFRRKYSDKNAAANMIYSRNALVSTNPAKTVLSGNAIVVGGPGSGKDFHVLVPNLLQMDGNYFVVDPGGIHYRETADMFKSAGYSVKVLDLIQPNKSNSYNPFKYMEADDAEWFADFLLDHILNSDDEAVRAEKRSVLKAATSYVMECCEPSERNISQLTSLLKQCSTKSGDETTGLLQADAGNICETAAELLKDLAALEIGTVIETNNADDMELNMFESKPMAIYVIIPIGENPYQLFSSLFIEHAMNIIRKQEWNEKHNRTVKFMLNEFANLGGIGLHSIYKKKGVSFTIFIQALTQLKMLYPDDWRQLMDLGDVLVYLGYNEANTVKEMVKISNTACGTDIRPKEITNMNPKDCLVYIKGYGAFVDEKYPTKGHPNYSKLMGV